MPIIRTAGPITFDGQLAALPAADGNPYTENIKIGTENQPVTFDTPIVEYEIVSGTAGQKFIETK